MASNSAGASPGAVSVVKERAGEVGVVAGEEATAVVEESKFEAQRLIQQSRETLRAEAATQTTRIASTLRDIGQQLRTMTQQPGTSGIAVDVGRQLADTAQRAATKLDDNGVETLMTDLKRFARRRPGAFLAGALGAGFVTGRLLKAADTHSLMDAATQRDATTQRDDRRMDDSLGESGEWTTLTGADPALAPASVDLTSEMP